MDLSVIIPCLNEIETISKVIHAAKAALRDAQLDGEVILADNGSMDGSQEAAYSLGARVVNLSKKGYGNALRGGIAASQGRCFIFADADASYDFSQLGKFWNKLETGAEMVVGTRFPRAGGIIDHGAMPWLHRWVGTPAISLIGRILFGSRLSDFNCGMRAMRRDAYDRLQLQTSGMEFASEMIIKAQLFHLRVVEVPIHFHKDGRRRPPHLRTFRDGWRHLRFMLICSPLWLFVYPGILLAVCGLIAMSLLIHGTIRVFGIGWDTNTLLVSAMAVLLGHQLLVLGATAKLYAVQIGMHPSSKSGEIFKSLFHLETWSLAGGFLVITGIGLMLHGIGVWKAADFGALSYPDSLRIVIPAVTLIMIGAQTIFSSFLISMVSRSDL